MGRVFDEITAPMEQLIAKGSDGLREYQADTISTSIDGLPALPGRAD